MDVFAVSRCIPVCIVDTDVPETNVANIMESTLVNHHDGYDQMDDTSHLMVLIPEIKQQDIVSIMILYAYNLGHWLHGFTSSDRDSNGYEIMITHTYPA